MDRVVPRGHGRGGPSDTGYESHFMPSVRYATLPSVSAGDTTRMTSSGGGQSVQAADRKTGEPADTRVGATARGARQLRSAIFPLDADDYNFQDEHNRD